MAAILDAEIHCIYVVESPAVYGTFGMEPIPALVDGELFATAKKQLQRFVDEHAAKAERPAILKVLDGRPREEIVNYANDIGAGMIVMSTHGYSGLKHALLGSTTEAVLRLADCPVLSIPPAPNDSSVA
jgi:nucleotide-binding universal stress UspA family protein